MTKHFKVEIEVLPNDLPRELAERRVLMEHYEEQRKLLHEYIIDRKNVCKRKDGNTCRPEVLRELAPDLPEITLGPRTVVELESCGQYSEEECVRRALQNLAAEARHLEQSIRECAQSAHGEQEAGAP